MKNILYLHAGAEMYGADKILLELVTGLDKTKFNPIVILPNEGILKEKLQKKGINTYVINYPILRRKYFNLKGIINYSVDYFKYSRRIIDFLNKRKLKIDIIHVNTTAVLEGIYLKKKLNTKLLWHVHEIIINPKFVFKTISWLIGKYADKCVVVSKAVKIHLLKSNNIESGKIEIIYNGVDSNKFSSNVENRYLFKELNIPRNSIRVGVIGRINAWKGQDDFLDAAIPLLDIHPTLYLFIIGSAFSGQEWRVSALKKRIKKEQNNSRIIYLPFREDVAAIQNFLNLLVLPSINPDPLPTVVLEAMACGKPVVGYAHGGVTEMVSDNYNGLLAEPRDTVDLRLKISSIISSPQKIAKLGINSKKRQLKYFSVESLIMNFESIYDRI
ncbi:glycosyltransferase family 4 protein [Liquorilactobacillus ghanensis]|nr:glycosyltransferase family 4 protein [Liquorilactobacillus ghanensis]